MIGEKHEDRSSRRLKRIVLAVCALVFAAPLAIIMATSSEPRIQHRRQVLVWKFSGSIPYVSWSETFRALLPGRWRYGSPPSGFFIKEKTQGDEPCPVLWDTPIGAFWGQRNDDVTLDDLWRLERYQRGPASIHAGDVVVDVGSQIGTFTRIALDRGAAQVIAIEPDPGDDACFKRTFQKEIASGRVILLEAALWESSGTMKFTIASRSDAGALTPDFDPRWGGVRMVDVPTLTLDEAVQRLKLTRVDFIKWAIPGAQHALLGSRETLTRFHPRMVMVVCISPEDAVALPPIVLQAVPGYHVLTHEVELAYFY